MTKKYIFLYLIALIVITGCIELSQTQAEKMGWNQAKYEEYSAYYDILRPPPGKTVTQSEYNAISKNMTIDEWLISIPKDKNELENTWYLVFYHIKKAQDTPYDRTCNTETRNLDMNPAVREAQNRAECEYITRDRYMVKLNESYSKAIEYRQKIEDMKANLSR
jgi:hypothetical protein